jgi:Protein of unknown function (DUF2971)
MRSARNTHGRASYSRRCQTATLLLVITGFDPVIRARSLCRAHAYSNLLLSRRAKTRSRQGRPMTPISHLYRFRSVERLLDHGELQNQEIYFAKPEELNDPMEGFRDIFWRGDEIVWGSLFRHYLLCLERAFSLLVILGEKHRISWDQIPVFNYGDTSFTVQQKQKQDEIIDDFIKDNGIKACIKALASRSVPLRRNELAFYLRSLHLFAISRIRDCYERHKLFPKQDFETGMIDKLMNTPALVASAMEHMRTVEENAPINEFALDAFFAAQQRQMTEIDLINLYNQAIDPLAKNRNFVFLTFCDEYVNRIETLFYPDWYTACFMRECRNSAVWGSYGMNHTAVCLKFKVRDNGGRPILRLNRLNGWGSAGPTLGKMDHEFIKIIYDNDHLPIDFFNSLGRLPIPTLKQYWYSDKTGRISVCGKDIFNNEDKWRAEYWDAFKHGITRKLKDWDYEQEHRLVLSGSLLDFSDVKSRSAKYDFDDLDGIIFGIKTPSQRKLDIFKIIEEKCRESKRTDFKFYQAFYSRDIGTIEHAEMSFLKFPSLSTTAAEAV